MNDLRGIKSDHTKTTASEKKAAAKEKPAKAAATEKVAASSLGRLNAAHASERALANASPNSTVGRIGAYKAALEDGDLAAAAEALASVSNKAVTEASVRSLNGLLGVTAEETQITEIVDKVEVLQEQKITVETTTTTTTSTTTTTAAMPTEEVATSPTKTAASMGRLNAAHASPRAMERASLNSPVGQIGAYKTAVAAGDLDAAAAALAKASNKPLTAETVRNLNGLLDTALAEEDVTKVVEKAEALKVETTTKASSKKASATR